jgi:diketogulonate reductase-like aldo/keto reductase
MDALRYLFRLRDRGTIKHVGLTNFDTGRMQTMLDSDLCVILNQVEEQQPNKTKKDEGWAFSLTLS